MFVIDHDALSGVRNSPAVRKRHIKPHFGLFAGCGCQFFPDGTWVDGVPSQPIRAGQEPARPCRAHLRAHYSGIDISFPGGHNEDADDERRDGEPTHPDVLKA